MNNKENATMAGWRWMDCADERVLGNSGRGFIC